MMKQWLFNKNNIKIARDIMHDMHIRLNSTVYMLLGNICIGGIINQA